MARTLYEWVSTNVRYVAVNLGLGAVEPHTAESVLSARYGDCKDHVVLLMALLKARDIDSEPVLINSDDSYALGDPPTLTSLNHVIIYIPELDLYADSTAAFEPFGALPFNEYGKPAVHAMTEGDALRRIPFLESDRAMEDITTIASLLPDGTISGSTMMKATGPFAGALRIMAKRIEAKGSAQAAHDQLQFLGSPGTGSFTYGMLRQLSDDFVVTASFTLEPRTDIIEGAGFAMRSGLRLLVRPGELLLGPRNLGELKPSDPAPCYPGRQVEHLSLKIPPTFAVARVPKDIQIDNDMIAYTSHWTSDRDRIEVHRELLSKAAGPLCSDEARDPAVAAMKRIAADVGAVISLVER